MPRQRSRALKRKKVIQQIKNKNNIYFIHSQKGRNITCNDKRKKLGNLVSRIPCMADHQVLVSIELKINRTKMCTVSCKSMVNKKN